MHIPKSFKINDDELFPFMQENAFATIVTTDEDNLPVATQLPFLLKQQEDKILLQAHFAKANPQWRHLEKNAKVLVIFQGPHCYISPSWYKDAGVPTWDYVSVQAYGRAQLFQNDDQLRELIEVLSDKYESSQENPWKAKNNYSEVMLKAIVGFEISVQELQGKVKIGQNKSEADLSGVIEALSKPHQNSSPLQKEHNLAIASLIKKHLKSRE